MIVMMVGWWWWWECGGWFDRTSWVSLECHPEIPVTPGEEYSVLDTSLDMVYFAPQWLEKSFICSRRNADELLPQVCIDYPMISWKHLLENSFNSLPNSNSVTLAHNITNHTHTLLISPHSAGANLAVGVDLKQLSSRCQCRRSFNYSSSLKTAPRRMKSFVYHIS